MEKKQDPKHHNPLNTQYADDMTQMDVISATEVTGMVARPPLNEAEVEGYLTLFPVEQQEAYNAKAADGPAQQKAWSHMGNEKEKK